MGYKEYDAIQAYMSCGKNELAAANTLAQNGTNEIIKYPLNDFLKDFEFEFI